MANVKRKYNDKGIIVGKLYVEEKDAREFKKDGQIVSIPASEEKYKLYVVSSQETSDLNGMIEPVLSTIDVSKELFNKAKYQGKVELVFEMSQYGIKHIDTVLV